MKKKIYRFVALFTVINLVVEIFFPAISYALTSGPSQPEHVQFAPIGADNTVDLFSGDFSYNIPLFELPGPDGGYPFNLSYQAGVGVEDEASWVGLGWNISPGAINRQMRGLPDEFKGEGDYKDLINQKLHKRDNITNSLSLGASLNKEFIGTEFLNHIDTEVSRGRVGVGLNLTFRNNSYTGIGYAISPSISGNLPLISQNLGSPLSAGLGLSASLGVTLDSENGASLNGGVGLDVNASAGSSGSTSEESTSYDGTYEGGNGMSGSMTKYTTPRSYTDAGMGLNGSFSYNSRSGLTGVSFDVGLQGGRTKRLKVDTYQSWASYDGKILGGRADRQYSRQTGGISGSGGSGWSLDFNNTGAMPSIGIPMKVETYSLTLKTGIDVLGLYLAPNTSISQTKQQIAYADREVPAYGYNHSEKNAQNKGLMDFNREKEGMIYPNSKTLPSPHFTYDTYMVTGQGMLGSFRPYRSEIFTLGDRKEESVTKQRGGGVDISAKLTYFGANFDAVTGRSTSERMRLPYYDYKNAHSSNKTYESVFYKFQGEASILSENALRDVGGNVPLRFDLNKTGSPTKLVYSKAASKLEEAEGNKNITEGIKNAQNVTNEGTALDGQNAKLNKIVYPERAARNRAIFPVENQYASTIPEYTVHYRVKGETDYQVLDRLELDESDKYIYKPHHLAGFTCTSTNGMRYIYAMPVRNFEQKEVVKSVENSADRSDTNYANSGWIGSEKIGRQADGTELFESEITTPEYATSHLLTSVLGNDYVDVDPQTNPGPSENDLGYWVKYSYEKIAGTYNWRMPYNGANFTEGLRSTDFDDKISYIEGKKELVYLSQVETKTHIAKFSMSNRSDAKGTGSSAAQQKLDKIEIYAKTDPSKPLKTVHFVYYTDNGDLDDESLCKGLPNADVGKGKLTLKQVYFTYQNITRGGISPYEFEYVKEYNGNPLNYSQTAQDAWGTYSNLSTNDANVLSQSEHPYVNQEISEAKRNAEAAAWSLNKITFPSGSSMRIEYESDDYAYVQDRKAMQMTKFILPNIEYDNGVIVNVSPNINTDAIHSIRDFTLRNPLSTLSAGISTVAHPELRVYFPLTETHTGLSEEEQAKIVNTYLDDRDQVYFKTLVALRKDKDYENLETFVDIQTTQKKDGEVMRFTRGLYPEQGTHTHGYFTLEAASQKGRNFHPLSAAAWIKLRSEHPRLLNKSNNMNDANNLADFSLKDFMKGIRALSTMKEIFENYFVSADRNEWGRDTQKKYSYVRLNNVKGKKYGGGIRVKRIEFNETDKDENGNEDRTAENTYGQVYEYTTKDENGREISSGVASFEPSLAADENPLRYVEKFTNKVPALPSYPMFSEYPVNEGYYPSARVGYSKVTVKSIATAAKIQGGDNYEGLSFPSGISTTGVTVNEFYTYKDYPVLAAQSDVTYKNKPSFSIGKGLKTTSSSGASQGYVIELNNMNGVPKSMAHYGQNDDGVVQDIPISSSRYFYKTTSRQGKNAVDNLCPVLTKEKNGRIEKENKLVGVEYEVFMDARESKTSTKQWGVNANLTLLETGIPPFMIGFGGTLKEMNEEVRSVVVNKVIYRSGILDSVVVSDGLSVSSTKNLLWDENTGGVLLTSVNNNFDDRIYSYTIPAYTQYDQMGAAYKNIGFKFSGTVSTANGGRMFNATIPVLLPRDIWIKELIAGDELLVWKENTNTNAKENMHRVLFMGYNRETSRAEFFIVPQTGDPESGSPMQGNVEFMVYRSGRRNLLSASAGSINSLNDPTSEYSRERKIFSGKSILKK